MDIKSKNFKGMAVAKVFVVILCIIGGLLTTYGLMKVENYGYLFNDEYYIYNADITDVDTVYDEIFEVAFEYQNEAYIQTGVTVTDAEIEKEKTHLIDVGNNERGAIGAKYNELIENAEALNNTDETLRLKTELQERLQEQYLKQQEEIKGIKNKLIQEELKEFRVTKERLHSEKGWYYSVVGPEGTVISNANGVQDIESFYNGLALNGKYFNGRIKENHTEVIPEGYTIYMGVNPELYSAAQEGIEEKKQVGQIGIYQAVAGITLIILTTGYLMITAGRRGKGTGVELDWLDYPLLDIQFVVEALLIVGAAAMVINTWAHVYTRNPETFYAVSIPLVIFGVLMCLHFAVCVSKRIKRGELLKHTMVWKCIAWVMKLMLKPIRQVQEAMQAGPSSLRLVMVYEGYTAAIAFIFILFVVMAMAGPVGGFIGLIAFLAVNGVGLAYLMKKKHAFDRVLEGVDKIRGGDLNARIPIGAEPLLNQLASDIHNIAEGLKASVDNEVRAERLKAELVTNVSHDLKTPLTSIITYIDLLKTEGLEAEKAPEYLAVLDKKAQRLKNLTEDLFEAAKASSGTIDVKREVVNVEALIKQGIGELQDKIEHSQLDFRINCVGEGFYIDADGKLLWRVIENLFSNVFKYAQEKSRVYIDLIKENGCVQLSIKNISAHELNINAQELMERFVRGDKARYSEGSGLGLSIARSLTELQKGTFEVTVDGDLFKVVISFRAKEGQEQVKA